MLLLDEPFGALDQILRRTMNVELQRIWMANQTNSSPTAETLDEILTIPEGSRVLVIGHNGRSLSRLSGIVRDYANAKITVLTELEIPKIVKAAPAADVVVAVWSVVDVLTSIQGIKRLIVVRFVLDTSVNHRLKINDEHRRA